MNFALNEDHLLLRDSAQSFVDKETDLAPLLKPGATAASSAYVQNWQKVCDLGWTGLIVDEQYGGSGLDCVDLSVIVTEVGRTLFPAPLAGHVFATWTLMVAGSAAQKSRLLPGAASGEIQLALVPPIDGNTITEQAGKLTGVHAFVVDGLSSQKLIVAASTGSGTQRFFIVDPAAQGVSVTLQPWRDLTRQVVRVELKDVDAEPMPGLMATSWPWVRDRVACYLTAENVGGMRSVLAETVNYANQRVAFGRPIGAYQAIKHPLAEMLGKVESSSTALLYAAWALEVADERAALAASMAKAYSCEAYTESTHRSIQIFGAIGFTWEMKNHLYFKRARANAQLFGDNRAHRDHVVNLATGRSWSEPFRMTNAH